MSIRRLTLSDRDELFALRLRALQDTPTAYVTTTAEEKNRGPEFLESSLRPDTRNALFGGFDGGLLVGMVGIHTSDRPKLSHKAVFWGVFVEAPHRGKGMGSALVDAAIGYTRSLSGMAVITLTVESSNEGAKQVYRSRGFRSWGVEPRSMMAEGRYYDEDHFALEL